MNTFADEKTVTPSPCDVRWHDSGSRRRAKPKPGQHEHLGSPDAKARTLEDQIRRRRHQPSFEADRHRWVRTRAKDDLTGSAHFDPTRRALQRELGARQAEALVGDYDVTA